MNSHQSGAIFVAGLLIVIAILIIIGVAMFIIRRNAWRNFALGRLTAPDFRQEHPLLQLADQKRLVENIKLDSTAKEHLDLAVLKAAWLPYLRLSFAKILADNQVATTYPWAHYDIALRDVSDEQLLAANSLPELLALTDPKLAQLEPNIKGYEAAFKQYTADQKLTTTQIEQVLTLFSEQVDYHETVTAEQLANTFPAIADYLFKTKSTQLTERKPLPQWLTYYFQDQH